MKRFQKLIKNLKGTEEAMLEEEAVEMHANEQAIETCLNENPIPTSVPNVKEANGNYDNINIYSFVGVICFIILALSRFGFVEIKTDEESQLTVIDFAAIVIGVFFGFIFVVSLKKIYKIKEANNGDLINLDIRKRSIIAHFCLGSIALLSGCIAICLLVVSGYFFCTGRPYLATKLVDETIIYFEK